MAEHFGDILREFVEAKHTTAGRLAAVTDVPTKTITSWLQGGVKRPRRVDDILQVAAALRLLETEADRLLRATHNPVIAQLITAATANGDDNRLANLSWWITVREQGQGSTARIAPRPIPFQVPQQFMLPVGRQAQIETVSNSLQQNGQVCLLHGMSGIGKTTLANYLAHSLKEHFPDGVLWANLSNTYTNNQCDEAAIKAALSNIAKPYGRNLDDQPDLQSRSTAVRDLLTHKHALLILDDAYHSDVVSWFLPPATSPTSVLITSQNHHILAGQHHIQILEPFAPEQSLALLSQIIGPERVVQEGKGAKLLVAQLGHLPMAISIMAQVITDDITLAEYSQMLTDEEARLRILSNLTHAQSGLQLAFEHSFQRLSPPLQQLFSSLHIFQGHDFSVEGVAAATNTNLIETKQQLAILNRLSLLDKYHHPFTATSSRYRLHPLLNAFSLEKFALAPSTEITERAATYFLKQTQVEQITYNHLNPDWPHVKLALSWAKTQQDWAAYNQALHNLTTPTLGIAGFLDAKGYWAEAIDLLQQTPRIPSVSQTTYEQALFHYRLGLFAFRLAQAEQAEQQLQQAFDHLSVNDQTTPQSTPEVAILFAQTSDTLAELALQKSDLPRGLRLMADAMKQLERYQTIQAQQELGYLLIRQSRLLAMSQQLDKAITNCQQGLSLLPETPSAARVSGLMNLGILHNMLGKPDQAFAYFQQGADVAEAIGDDRRLAGIWNNMGIVETDRGNANTAIYYKDKALAVMTRLGDLEEVSTLRANLAEDHINLDQLEQAQTHLNQASLIANQHQFLFQQLLIAMNETRLYLKLGDLTQAQTTIKQAVTLIKQVPADHLQAELDTLLQEIGSDVDQPE